MGILGVTELNLIPAKPPLLSEMNARVIAAELLAYAVRSNRPGEVKSLTDSLEAVAGKAP